MGSFIDSILSNIRDEDVDLQVKLDCVGKKQSFSAKQFDIIYPPKAKEENVLLLSGGCIGKLSLSDKLSEIIVGDTKAKFDQTSAEQISEVDSLLEDLTDGSRESLSDFNNALKLKINDIIVNRIADKEVEGIPDFSIGLTKAEYGFIDQRSNSKILSFDDFSNKLSESSSKLPNTHTVFKFKFISHKTILKILSYLKGDDGTNSSIVINADGEDESPQTFRIKNYDGTYVDEYYDKFNSIINEEITNESEIDEIVSSVIGYLFPINEVDPDRITSSISRNKVFAYYTIVNKGVYFKFPDMSGNDIGGVRNIYGLGFSPFDGDLREFSYYMSLQIISSSNSFSFSPLKYMPPPSPTLKDYDLTLETDSSYTLTFDKEGLIDPGDVENPFGAEISDANNYKIVFSLLSDERTTFDLNGNINDLNNLIEHNIFPLASEALPLEEIVLGNNVDETIKNYFNRVENIFTEDILGEGQTAETFLSKIKADNSEDPEKMMKSLQEKFGIIPGSIKNGKISSKDIIGISSRYDIPLSLDSGVNFAARVSGKVARFRQNKRNVVKPAAYTQDDIMLSYRPKILLEESLTNFHISKTFTQLNLNETQNASEDGDADIFYLNINKSEFENKFNFGELSDKINFNIYIVDRFGQYTRVAEPKAASISFSSELPEVGSVTINGQDPKEAIIDNTFALTLKGTNLCNSKRTVLEIISIGFGELFRNVTGLSFEFPKVTDRTDDTDVFVNEVDCDGVNTTLTIVRQSLEDDTKSGPVTISDGLNIFERFRARLITFGSDDEILDETEFTIRGTADEPKEDTKRRLPLEPNSIRPRGFFGGYFYDIPITNDPNNHPTLRLKSRKRVFSNIDNLYCYLGAPVGFGSQSEVDVNRAFDAADLSENILSITMDDDKLDSIFPAYKDKVIKISKRIVFSTENNGILRLSSKKGSISFPGQNYPFVNFEKFTDLKNCCLIFTDKSIEEIALNRSSINLSEDLLTAADATYAILPIGAPEENSDLQERPFILPPRIHHIGNVRYDNFNEGVKLETNTYFNDILQKAYKKIEDSDDFSLRGLKEYIPDNDATGNSVYLPERSRYTVVIFESSSKESDIKDYRLSVGENRISGLFGLNFGLFSLGQGRRIYKEFVDEDEFSKKAIVVFKNVKPKVEGFQSLRMVRRDRRYNLTYDSTLIKNYTLDIQNVENNTYNISDGELVLNEDINSRLISNGVGVSLFDYGKYFPLREQINWETAFFTTALKVIPNITSRYMVVPASISGEKNSDQIPEASALQYFSENAINITIGENGSVALNEDYVQQLQNSINSILEQLEGAELDPSLESFIDLNNALSGNFSESISNTLNDIQEKDDTEKSVTEVLGELNTFLKAVAGVSATLDLKIDPLSPLDNILRNGIDNIEDLIDSINFNNESVAMKDEVYIPSGTSLSPSKYVISQDGSTSKIFLSIRWDSYSDVRCLIPRIVGLKEGNGDLIPTSKFPDVKLEVGKKYEMFFENFNPRKNKIEVDGLIILRNTRNSIKFKLTEENITLQNFTRKIFMAKDDCNVKITATSDNAIWQEGKVVLGNRFANEQGRLTKGLSKVESFMEDVFVNGPAKGKQLVNDKLKSFCDNASLDFIKDGICGGGLKNTIKSICDFSFHASIELSIHLRSFKKLLIVIKVILCIIDVLCALTNPKKLAFALIRLFLCLFELLLLLPQLSIPVMFLKLLLHLLELLICIIDKVIFAITAINEIMDAIQIAVELRNLAAIKNLEEVLDKYLVSLELDLAILDPILDILAIFLELLELLFRFPCRVGEGDDLGILCLEASNVAGLIASKVAPTGAIEHQYLIPVAQSYTTLSEDNVNECGNTPAEAQDNSDTRPTLLNTGDPCGFGGGTSGTVVTVSEMTNKSIVTKTDDQNFIDVLTVENSSGEASDGIDHHLRISNNPDYQPTFQVSYTKSKKRRFGSGVGGILEGPDPRKVTFQFNNKAESFGLGKWLIIKKIIDNTQTLDSPLKLMNVSGNELKVANGKGKFVSIIDSTEDSFVNSDFTVKPITLQFSTLDGATFQTTYDTVPSMAIMDDQFNVYFIEEIKFNADDQIEEIDAVMINKISADTFKFSKEEVDVPKSGDDGKPYREQANFEYINGLGYGDIPAFEAGATQEQIDALPYPDDGAEDYTTNEDDALKLSSSVESRKIYDFPTLYFIDVRQFTDEIIEACSVNGMTDIFGAMELGDNAAQDIADIVQDQLDCIQTFTSGVTQQISTIRNQIGQPIPATGIAKMDPVRTIQLYNELVECTNDSIDRICRFVFNPLNTSFKLTADVDFEERADAVDPTTIDPTVLADVAGTPSNVEFPEITGAEEYASGIGDEITVIEGTTVFIETIPRDSYDDVMPNDVSEKISINIISDTTGTAQVNIISDNGVSKFAQKDGSSYFSTITVEKPGVVKIIGSVCGKTIKAFTYNGLTSVDGDVVSEENCVDIVQGQEDSLVPAGALIRIDRVLTINVIEATDENKVGIISNVDADGFGNKTKSITNPQQLGTKLEN